MTLLPGFLAPTPGMAAAGALGGPQDSKVERQSPGPEALADCPCRGLVSATQVANLFWEELAADATFDDQVAIVSKYLELLDDGQPMPADRQERLALGEAMFLTFQAQEAHDYFATLLDGDDLISRHAWDRLMQIRFRAFDRVDETWEMMERFHDRFPPSELHTRGRYQQIGNFVGAWIQDGETDRAVGLLIDEIERLPTDAPYNSFALLAQYREPLAASSRSADLRAIVRAKRDGLERTLREWRRSPLPASLDPVVQEAMPIWYWRQGGVRPGESLRGAQIRQMDGLTAALTGWLDGPVAELVTRYAGLDFYADVTTSVLHAESPTGQVFGNRNEYTTTFHRALGARLDGYLGQTFTISGWDTVTNWLKNPARYSVAALEPESDWRTQFVPIGSMIDTEHPAMSILIDGRTGAAARRFPGLRRVDEVTEIEWNGRRAVLIEGLFTFSAQGINFGASSATEPVAGKLWIDAETGLLRRQEFDVTGAYSDTFGPVERASLTVSHDDISTAPPASASLESFRDLPLRAADVERAAADLFTAAPATDTDDGTINYLVGRPAPRVAGPTLDGGSYDLRQSQGRAVVLFFWATWCPNCARVMEQIDAFASARTDDVDVLGVNVDSFVGRAVLEAYYAERTLRFRSVLDEGNAIASAFRAIAIPTAVVIDASGVVRHAEIGASDDLARRLERALATTG